MPSTLDAPFGPATGQTPTTATHNTHVSLSIPNLAALGDESLTPGHGSVSYGARPSLRHSNSSAAAMTGSGPAPIGTNQNNNMDNSLGNDRYTSDYQGRLRSGSLTTPDHMGASTVSNAFGSGFSNTWLQNPAPAGRSSLNQVTTARSRGPGDLHQVISRESTSSGNSSGNGEDNYAISQSTVDYLGLADNMETPRAMNFGFQNGPSAPVNSSLNPSRSRGVNQEQLTPNAAMAARNRANTVSVQPKSSASFQDLISAANLGLGRDHSRPVGLFDNAGNGRGTGGYLNTGDVGRANDPYGSSPLYGLAGGVRNLKDDASLLAGLSGAVGSRPRATTISMLDQPSARLGAYGMQGSADLMDSLITPSTTVPQSQSTGLLDSHNEAGRRTAGGDDGDRNRRREKDVTRNGPAADAAAGQTPTRSIWLGNLDVMTTAQDLMQVFQGYGEIESLRLLPEKVCV